MTTQITDQLRPVAPATTQPEAAPAWKHTYYAVHLRDRSLGEGSEEGPIFQQVHKGQSVLESLGLDPFSQMEVILALEIPRQDYWDGVIELMFSAQQQLEF